MTKRKRIAALRRAVKYREHQLAELKWVILHYGPTEERRVRKEMLEDLLMQMDAEILELIPRKKTKED